MSLPALISLFVILYLSLFTIRSSITISKAKKRLLALEKERDMQAFAEVLLNDISSIINTSLDIPKVLNMICKHLANVLTCSTVSTLLVKGDKLILRTDVKENVSSAYIEDVKERMIASLASVQKHDYRFSPITEHVSGNKHDTSTQNTAGSVFHMPLFLYDNVIALITITSTKEDTFPTADIEALQHVINQTSRFISKLDGILQEQQRRLQAMVGSLADGVVMIDNENRLQIINPAAKQLLSLKDEEIATMDVLSALPIHFDFRSKILAAIHQNKSSEIANVPVKNKQLRCRISPVLGTTGKTLGASLLMRDETLTNSVPRMKEDFTNIIVHELRNPLTSIKASSELLISPVKFSPEEQHKLINVIYQQSNKLLTEVQQILDAAKLEAGVFIIHKKTADLKVLISRVTESFQKEAQEKMIKYIVDVEFHLPSFSFDEKYLGEALSNLLSNSMKFTSQGGTIQITAKQKHGNAHISIADTGAGIPKDKQHKLFNKFSQIEDASASVGKGLGLYLARGIVEAHGGTVDIDSDRGRGTTISITLPMHETSHHLNTKSTNSDPTQNMVN